MDLDKYIDYLYDRDCWNRCIYNAIPDCSVYPYACLNRQKHERYKYCPQQYDCLGHCNYESTLNDYIIVDTLESELKENLVVEFLKDNINDK